MLRNETGLYLSEAEKVMLELYAETDENVLFTGETGTGKTVFAEELHKRSKRNENPFIEAGLSSMQVELMASRIFGQEKGAFTGAIVAKLGAISEARNGTLFLDEIGDLPLDAQVRLLKPLEEKKFRRIGGGKLHTCDARIVTATNADLKEKIKEGSFRGDLYARLNVLPFSVSPLREKPEAVFALLKDWLPEGFPDFSTEVKDVLRNYKWPENIRELKSFAKRALLVTNFQKIELSPEQVIQLLKNQVQEVILGKILSVQKRDIFFEENSSLKFLKKQEKNGGSTLVYHSLEEGCNLEKENEQLKVFLSFLVEEITLKMQEKLLGNWKRLKDSGALDECMKVLENCFVVIKQNGTISATLDSEVFASEEFQFILRFFTIEDFKEAFRAYKAQNQSTRLDINFDMVQA